MAFQLKIENVLISDNLDNCCQEILSENGIDVKVDTKLTKEDLLKEISVSTLRYRRISCETKHSLFYSLFQYYILYDASH